MFTVVRAAAVALTLGGAALMGHSGIDSARAATAADSPAGSPALAAPAMTSTDCDKSKSDDKAKPDVADLAKPAEKDSDTDKPDTDKDKDTDKDSDKASDDKDKDKDKEKKDKADDKDRKDHETCTTSTTSVGGVSVPLPPPAAPPATGSGVKAVSTTAPVTAVPRTGAEVPFAAGLLLTTAGAGALIAGRRRRRSE
jgi:hypothetical protein